MIVNVYKEANEPAEFVTNGCSCCAQTLYEDSNKEEILTHLRSNLRILQESCEILGIDTIDFVLSNLTLEK